MYNSVFFITRVPLTVYCTATCLVLFGAVSVSTPVSAGAFKAFVKTRGAVVYLHVGEVGSLHLFRYPWRLIGGALYRQMVISLYLGAGVWEIEAGRWGMGTECLRMGAGPHQGRHHDPSLHFQSTPIKLNDSQYPI